MSTQDYYFVKIVGHASPNGNHSKNMMLSKERAENTLNHIKSIKEKIATSCSWHGDTLNAKHGNQRKVEVLFKYKISAPKEEIVEIIDVPKPETPVKKENEFSVDPEVIKALKKNDTLILTDLIFRGGTDIFFPSGETPQSLYDLSEFLFQNPELKVQVNGHVCCARDMALSLKRAKKVESFLIRQGISKSRIKSVGHSNQHPLTLERTALERQKNRRVEIVIK